MIKCVCTLDGTCQMGISFPAPGQLRFFWAEGKIPNTETPRIEDRIMYLDANALVALIQEARAQLLALSDTAPRE